MTEQDTARYEQVVLRRIPPEWREDLVIVEINELASANGRPAGTPYVDLAAKTKLARAQAELSLGSYVHNEIDDWRTMWRSSGSDGAKKMTIRLWDPSAAPVDDDAFAEHLSS